MALYKHCCPSLITMDDHTDYCLSRQDEAARLKEALRLVYGYAAAIQRMTAYASIGFRCSLIRETVSRALPDDEAKRLHDETEIILDTLMDDQEAAGQGAERLETEG